MFRFFIEQFLSACLLICAYFIRLVLVILLRRYFPDIMNEIELNEIDIRGLERLENEYDELNEDDEGDEDDEDYENDENENILSIADMMAANTKLRERFRDKDT